MVGIDFVDPITGWVGKGGKILMSADGGATWALQRDASHFFNLIDVSFADLNHGWTVGGEELHTTDGGTNRTNQATGVFASVFGYAVSPTTAWIGGLGDLGRTKDGGATWTIENPSVTDWFAVLFPDASNGWAVGQDENTDDVPGSTWRRTEGTITAVDDSKKIFAPDLDYGRRAMPPSNPER